MADLVSGLGLLEKFEIIFPFLLILTLVYAVLNMSKILGDNKGLTALISFAVAIITLFSPVSREIINIMAPWFVILFIFLVFILVAFRIFGDVDYLEFFKGENGKMVAYWVAALALIIFFGSIATAFFGQQGVLQETDDTGQSVLERGEVGSEGRGAFWATITHPNVLGMIVILLIALFTIQRLATYG